MMSFGIVNNDVIGEVQFTCPLCKSEYAAIKDVSRSSSGLQNNTRIHHVLIQAGSAMKVVVEQTCQTCPSLPFYQEYELRP